MKQRNKIIPVCSGYIKFIKLADNKMIKELKFK